MKYGQQVFLACAFALVGTTIASWSLGQVPGGNNCRPGFRCCNVESWCNDEGQAIPCGPWGVGLPGCICCWKTAVQGWVCCAPPSSTSGCTDSCEALP